MHRLVVVGGVLCQLAALVCLAVAFARRDDAVVEGAYFSRAVGEAPDEGVYALAQAPITAWLVSAAVLVVAGTALLLAALRRRRSPG